MALLDQSQKGYTSISSAERAQIKVFNVNTKDDLKAAECSNSLAIFMVLVGKASYIKSNKVCHIYPGGGFFYAQSGLPKFFNFDRRFEAIVLVVPAEIVLKSLSAISYKMDRSRHHASLDILHFPENEIFEIFVKSVQHLCTCKVTPPSGVFESKIVELFWMLNESCLGTEFDSLLKRIVNPEHAFFDNLFAEHYAGNRTIRELATLSGYSLSTFKRRINKLYDCSPRELRQNLRLDDAKLKLMITSRTINSIAQEVGTQNASLLIKNFKLKFGYPPRKFRDNHS